jgi:hypothetical protein
MNRYRTVSTAALALVYLGVAFSASAQSFKEQVVGTWTLTAGMEKLPDGNTVTPWAAGNLTLTASGHMAFFVFAKDRPKGDGNPRTPVGPMVAYYGTYTVDEAKKSLTYNIEVASAPTFDKAVRVQTVALSGDVMTTTASPVKTPEGDIIPINEWKRAK